ncbi:MAG: DUF5668 domain-containing protein [Cyclobacteriaceae bacterium]
MKDSKRSLVLGVIFISLGAIFLFENLEILPFDFFDYFFNWKGILIIIGAVLLATKDNKTPGYIFIAVGTFFILSEFLAYEFGLYWFNVRKLFWPMVVIGIGIIILTRRSRTEETFDYDEKKNGSTDFLNVTAILGGGDIKVNSQTFRGGNVTAIFGGGNYDLSSAELAPGPQVIDVFAMFGGATFIIPSDWNVRTEVTTIFGGFADKRRVNDAVPVTDPTKELIIKGTVLFGGGELKNFV